MAQRHEPTYEFETLPLEPVPAGTNLLLTGPALGGLRGLLFELLLGDDGVVVIAADSGARQVLSEFERIGGAVDTDRVRVVDCTQESDAELGEFVSSVGTPGDLTGIGIEYSNQYEQVYARGHDTVRTGIYTLTPLLVYSEDVRPVFRFVNTVTSRIRTADGLGIFAIDPAAHEDQILGSIAQSFDGRIHVREGDDGVELRVQGLADQPGEWTRIPAFD